MNTVNRMPGLQSFGSGLLDVEAVRQLMLSNNCFTKASFTSKPILGRLPAMRMMCSAAIMSQLLAVSNRKWCMYSGSPLSKLQLLPKISSPV